MFITNAQSSDNESLNYLIMFNSLMTWDLACEWRNDLVLPLVKTAAEFMGGKSIAGLLLSDPWTLHICRWQTNVRY